LRVFLFFDNQIEKVLVCKTKKLPLANISCETSSEVQVTVIDKILNL
jgi:hypothetical protein